MYVPLVETIPRKDSPLASGRTVDQVSAVVMQVHFTFSTAPSVGTLLTSVDLTGLFVIGVVLEPPVCMNSNLVLCAPVSIP